MISGSAEYEVGTLEKFRLIAQEYISRELVEDFANAPDVRVSGLDNFLSDHIILEVKQTILGQGPYSHPTAKYPSDWKEALKLRFAPCWFQDRWPVRWTTVIFDARVVYPKIKLPAEGHYVTVGVRKEQHKEQPIS